MKTHWALIVMAVLVVCGIWSTTLPVAAEGVVNISDEEIAEIEREAKTRIAKDRHQARVRETRAGGVVAKDGWRVYHAAGFRGDAIVVSPQDVEFRVPLAVLRAVVVKQLETQ